MYRVEWHFSECKWLKNLNEVNELVTELQKGGFSSWHFGSKAGTYRIYDPNNSRIY
jgi:hypothetical protein